VINLLRLSSPQVSSWETLGPWIVSRYVGRLDRSGSILLAVLVSYMHVTDWLALCTRVGQLVCDDVTHD